MQSLQLPVELQRVNHTASTNIDYFTLAFQFKTGWREEAPCAIEKTPPKIKHLYIQAMAISPNIEQVTEKVERLLLRYEELQRTNALLAQEVSSLQTERDSLKSRLQAARTRVDALLDRLPEAKQTSSAHAS